MKSKLEFDISANFYDSFYVSRFNLESIGYRMPTLREDAIIRMSHPNQIAGEFITGLGGGYVQERVICIGGLKGQRFLSKIPSTLEECRIATENSKRCTNRTDPYDDYFWNFLTEQQVKLALNNSIQIPNNYDGFSIPLENFDSNPIIQFIFEDITRDFKDFIIQENKKVEKVSLSGINNGIRLYPEYDDLYFEFNRITNLDVIKPFWFPLRSTGISSYNPYGISEMSNLDGNYLMYGVKK